jgi:Ribbon-helix-helix protein, copG family
MHWCLAFFMILYYIVTMQSDTLSLRITKAESRALRERARKEGVSQGSLVRRALRAYGVTADPEPDKTAYDVIKHLLGRSRGKSKDLSTNPEHLKEYGR